MLDSIFGSHYLDSATQLCAEAVRRLDASKGLPEIQEAIRLYRAGLLDADAGINEIEAMEDSADKRRWLANATAYRRLLADRLAAIV